MFVLIKKKSKFECTIQKKNDRFRNHDFIVKDLFKDNKKLPKISTIR